MNSVKMPSNTLPPNPNPSHIYYPPHRHKPGRFQRRFPRTSIGIMTVVITWPIWLIGIGIMSAVRSRVGKGGGLSGQERGIERMIGQGWGHKLEGQLAIRVGYKAEKKRVLFGLRGGKLGRGKRPENLNIKMEEYWPTQQQYARYFNT